MRLRVTDGRALATTRSDGKGNFTFKALPNGALVVEASIDEVTTEVPVTGIPGESTPVELLLVLDDD